MEKREDVRSLALRASLVVLLLLIVLSSLLALALQIGWGAHTLTRRIDWDASALTRRIGWGVNTFTNPILQQGQDPSLERWEGQYYLVQSDGASIYMYRSASLTGIASGIRLRVAAPICCQVWAPELKLLDGRWFIYYAASAGDNASHRMYVLESATANPLGPYFSRGKIAASTDRWAIDGTVLTLGAAEYFIWSGWAETSAGQADQQQNLYIAPMRNPWTISGDRSLLSSPTAPWEMAAVGPHQLIGIEEGPEVLQHNGRTFLIFSANGSWTQHYCLGMLTYLGGPATSASSWVKSSGCVFASNPAAGVYGPGHNGFTQSPDGSQDWIVYHADASPDAGWAGRSVRAQPFTWRSDGTPDFGKPVATATALSIPAGQAAAP